MAYRLDRSGGRINPTSTNVQRMTCVYLERNTGATDAHQRCTAVGMGRAGTTATGVAGLVVAIAAIHTLNARGGIKAVAEGRARKCTSGKALGLARFTPEVCAVTYLGAFDDVVTAGRASGVIETTKTVEEGKKVRQINISTSRQNAPC